MPAVELLAAMVESSDDAILAVTLDGTIVHWNRATEDLYGHTSAEAVGAHTALIVPDDRRDELDESMTAIRAGERVAPLETVRVQSRFLAHFALRRLDEGFTLILAAGHRLPEPRTIGALEQQHLQIRGMNHYQHRDRYLVSLCH